MTRSMNKYCSGSDCLCTRKFYEVDDFYICEYCRKKLYKVLKR